MLLPLLLYCCDAWLVLLAHPCHLLPTPQLCTLLFACVFPPCLCWPRPAGTQQLADAVNGTFARLGMTSGLIGRSPNAVGVAAAAGCSLLLLLLLAL